MCFIEKMVERVGKMRSSLQNLFGKPTGRNVSILALAVLVMLSTTPAMAASNSLSVVTDKYTYNIGDPIYVSGTATPNASVVVTLLDPSNVTVVVSQVQVASNGNYSIGTPYSLKMTDGAGFWIVVAYDTSSNKTAKASFDVVSLWERIQMLESDLSSLRNQTQTLGGQITVLQNDIQTLNGTVGTLEASVGNLSSSLSAAESTSSIIAYGAIAVSIFLVVLSIVAMRRKSGFVPPQKRR